MAPPTKKIGEILSFISNRDIDKIQNEMDLFRKKEKSYHIKMIENHLFPKKYTYNHISKLSNLLKVKDNNYLIKRKNIDKTVFKIDKKTNNLHLTLSESFYKAHNARNSVICGGDGGKNSSLNKYKNNIAHISRNKNISIKKLSNNSNNFFDSKVNTNNLGLTTDRHPINTINPINSINITSPINKKKRNDDDFSNRLITDDNINLTTSANVNNDTNLIKATNNSNSNNNNNDYNINDNNTNTNNSRPGLRELVPEFFEDKKKKIEEESQESSILSELDEEEMKDLYEKLKTKTNLFKFTGVNSSNMGNIGSMRNMSNMGNTNSSNSNNYTSNNMNYSSNIVNESYNNNFETNNSRMNMNTEGNNSNNNTNRFLNSNNNNTKNYKYSGFNSLKKKNSAINYSNTNPNIPNILNIPNNNLNNTNNEVIFPNIENNNTIFSNNMNTIISENLERINNISLLRKKLNIINKLRSPNSKSIRKNNIYENQEGKWEDSNTKIVSYKSIEI